MVSKNITLSGKNVDSLLNHLEKMEETAKATLEHVKAIRAILKKNGAKAPTKSVSDGSTSDEEVDSDHVADVLKSVSTTFDEADVKKMDRKTVVQELKDHGVKETDVPRGDGASGKPLIGDLRNKLIEVAGNGKPSTKKAPAKKEPAAKKAPAKKEPAAKKAPAKKEPAAKKAPAKKEPESESESESEVVVTAFPELGYGLDQHGFVYTLPSKGETGEVVARLVNDEVKPLVKTSIAKLEKLDISFSKKTAKELKDLLVPEAEEIDEDEIDESEAEAESESEAEAEVEEAEAEAEVEEAEAEAEVEEAESESSDDEFGDEPEEGVEVEEATDVQKHFDSPPEVTEGDFRKFVEAQYRGDIKLSKGESGSKDIAKKTGLDPTVVGTIVVKYNEFAKKWPRVISDAKRLATGKVTARGKPVGARSGGRSILKKR